MPGPDSPFGAHLEVWVAQTWLVMSASIQGVAYINPNVCADLEATPEATAAIAFQKKLGYCDDMEDLKLEVPVTEEVEVDVKTLAALDRGTADADAGRVVSLEEARKRVPQWISKFESPKPR